MRAVLGSPAAGAHASRGLLGEKLTLNQHGAPAHPVEADVQLVRELARFIRTETIRLIGIAKSGHFTSVFSCAEILAALYSGVLRLSDDPAWPERDRLILSKGHCAVGVYPILARRGYFPSDWLDSYTRVGSPSATTRTCAGCRVSTSRRARSGTDSRSESAWRRRPACAATTRRGSTSCSAIRS